MALCATGVRKGQTMLPFTEQQFFEVFAAYNTAVWPLQVFAYAGAALCLWAVARPSSRMDRMASLILGLMWIATGAGYHFTWFAEINPAAALFGLAFVMQGVAFLSLGWRGSIAYGFRASPAAFTGLGYIAYSLLLYPLIAIGTGHAYPRLPMFGVTPCPLTLFSFGMLLVARPKPSLAVWVIPALWSLIGGSAAFLLGVTSDWPLLFGGVLALVLFGARTRRGRHERT